MTSAPHRPLAATRLAGLVAAAALSGALLAGCGSAARPAGGPGAITFNSGTCGANWKDPKPGDQTLRVDNQSAAGAEVDLIDPASGAVYAEADDIGPGTTASMQVDLGSGSYALLCLIEDADPLQGPVVKIAGHVKGDPAVLPVTSNDLNEPARQYQAYVSAGLVALAAQVKTLDADVRAGNLTAARSAWLPAHLTYERLGAAYGTFGDYDTEIDGTATGLAGGTASPDFTGFYRVEYGLWHGQTASQLTGPADTLQHDVLALQKAFPGMQVALLDIGLRTHEILENALQFQLSGQDDYGSGTTLATTGANIAGTQELLTVLHPLLAPRYKGLPQAITSLGKLQALVQAQHHPDGSWTPAAALAASSREQIDAATGQTLQDLAPIAVITLPRQTKQP